LDDGIEVVIVKLGLKLRAYRFESALRYAGESTFPTAEPKSDSSPQESAYGALLGNP